MFVFFIFPNFKWLLSKILWKNHPFLFIMDFDGSNEVLLGHKYFWSSNFWQWNDGPFKNFEISTEIYFVSIFFEDERNITTSLLMILLKCAVVHHANLNSSSTNNLYLRTVEYVISFFFFFFFEIIFCIYFNEAFIKNSMKILSFLIKISKINFKM